MRVKTEARRTAIIETAARLFRETGYERTSMATISAELGGSKATLYGYFPSKEELFVAVVERSAHQELDPTLDELERGPGELRTRLQRFGEAFLAFVLHPDTAAHRRMIIAEAGTTDLGRLLYESGPKRLESRVADFLATAMRGGLLRRAEPRLAALQLIALIEAESALPNLLGMTQSVSKARIAQMVRRGVATFLAAYATVGRPPRA